MALLPVESLALLVPEQLLGPDPRGVTAEQPGPLGPVAHQQPGPLLALLPAGRDPSGPPSRLLEDLRLAPPVVSGVGGQVGRRALPTLGRPDSGLALEPDHEVPAQLPAGIDDPRPGQAAVGQERDLGPLGQAGRHLMKQAEDQPGHRLGLTSRGIAGAGDRQGPLAIGHGDLHAPQVVAIGRLVEDRSGQLGPDGLGIDPVVGQGPLDPPLDAGRSGVAGDRDGELAGPAVVGDGHGEAQVGQGLGLVAVKARQEFVSNLPPPVA
jgi:hypothetical protein